MFDKIDKQNLADALLNALDKLPAAEKAMTLAALQEFERTAWYPQVFEEVAADFHCIAVNGTAVTVGDNAEDILHILGAYILAVEQRTAGKIFGTNEAMQYVSDELGKRGHGMTIWGVKKYINREDIQGQLVGKSLVFNQATLDRFIRNYVAHPPRTGPKGPRAKKESAF